MEQFGPIVHGKKGSLSLLFNKMLEEEGFLENKKCLIEEDIAQGGWCFRK